MRTVSQISAAIILMGAFQGFFFALLCLSDRAGRVPSNRILALFLVMVSAGLVSIYGTINGLTSPFTGLSRLGPAVIPVCIPLSYLYVKTLAVGEFRFAPSSLIHFLPVLPGAFPACFYGIPESGLSYPWRLASPGHFPFIEAACMAYALPYFLSMFALIKEHYHHMAGRYGKTCITGGDLIRELAVHKWIRDIAIVGMIFWILTVIIAALCDREAYRPVAAAVPAAMIYVLGFIGLRHPDIFYPADTCRGTARSGTSVAAAEKNIHTTYNRSTE